MLSLEIQKRSITMLSGIDQIVRLEQQRRAFYSPVMPA